VDGVTASVHYLLFCVNFFRDLFFFAAGEQSRHVPVGVMNSRNARINFNQNRRSQVSSRHIDMSYCR